MPRIAARVFVILSLAGALGACGDAPTSDTRGYTKAPLEKAGVFPKPEVRSPVAAFGETNRPRPVPIVLGDSARAGN